MQEWITNNSISILLGAIGAVLASGLAAMMTILTNEYFWGVITGVVLTAIGTWLQTILMAWQQRKAQRNLVKNFCIDTINNIKAIVDDMAKLQQRTKIIYADYMALLDVEINVFGRNREHIIHLPNPVRDDVRKFMNDCAIRKAEMGYHLQELTKIMTFADQLQAQGQAPQAQHVRTQQAPQPLAKATQALTQLADRVKDSTKLLNSLNGVK
jgi:hypothetical protein